VLILPTPQRRAGYQLGIAMQLCCGAALRSPSLLKEQPQGWGYYVDLATQVPLCWISAQSQVSQFGCK